MAINFNVARLEGNGVCPK